MKKWLGIVLVVVLLLAGCSGATEEKGETGLKKVSIVLDWTPNTNHTGLYVARDKGYFKEEGLDVEIILPGEAGADQLVASGKSEFGISAQESLTEARAQEIPIVSIGAIIQHNTSGLASPAGKNIQQPRDFEGKTYGGWGAPVEQAVLTSLMEADEGDFDKVDVINMGDTDFFTAVQRDIDFAWIYYAWTGVEAELRGEDLNMIYLTDYSDKLDYYTPVISTSEKMIEENSDTVKAFMKAVSKGYQLAMDNPKEAAEVLIKAEPDLDEELVRKSQEWLASRYQDDAARWGEQKQEIWQNYMDWMLEKEVLEKEIDVEQAFTNEFLPE
ncbi:ABC transporter substrate-binding protein [Lederbergia galactosidilytica]|uniref:ABC transporter substrate-binding protein n=1 Tax=Lederbergia galactosidilytica TaxID=217031 RepID=A0A178A5Z9_9BACI|nr:ABC transporter substrate-binding protein [Lederbergia galactosidilytica]KRG16185.1 ABC transporter substrate-binding protein [Virgibacillus soli]MBP1914053.1 ABC-type nitrate/sulfonate/bicarbonate transport system substrate-binding protein [Lederbergia galactosidilytica]OAK75615.1 ABC transporter substrate-binding protein [Lederbergia galactosidilytica]